MRRLAPLLATSFLALSGCFLSNASFQWREVSIDGQTQCLPVASSDAAQQRGLQGVNRVVRPMVFAYSPPTTPSFWMKDTPSALTGVWVGNLGRVIGYWHGQPGSTALHSPPAPITSVIEYRAGETVPPIGAPVAIGPGCRAADRRL